MLGLRGCVAPSLAGVRGVRARVQVLGVVPSRAFAADKPSHPEGLQYYISSYLMPQVRTVAGKQGEGEGLHGRYV